MFTAVRTDTQARRSATWQVSVSDFSGAGAPGSATAMLRVIMLHAMSIRRCADVFAISTDGVFSCLMCFCSRFIQCIDTVMLITRVRCRTCRIHVPADRNDSPNNCAIG